MEEPKEDLKKINERLRERLREAEDTLEAIRNGEVDAIILRDPVGKQVYSLINPDHPYQMFFENMDEAAIILSKEQLILYGNNNFFELVEAPSENIIGTSILDIIDPNDRMYFTGSLQKEKKKKRKNQNSKLSVKSKKNAPYLPRYSTAHGKKQSRCVFC